MTLHDCGVQEVEALFERLKDREEMAVGTSNEVRVDIDDVEFLVRSVWCCCSAFALAAGPEVTAKANKGLWRSTRALSLVRWDASAPCDLNNLVLMHYEEADEHEMIGLQAARKGKPKAAAFIERRLAQVARITGCS